LTFRFTFNKKQETLVRLSSWDLVKNIMTDLTSNVASNITLISLASLAVVFILIALAWKGFENRFIPLSGGEKKLLFKTVLIPMVPRNATAQCLSIAKHQRLQRLSEIGR
jgi:hypothetical protein